MRPCQARREKWECSDHEGIINRLLVDSARDRVISCGEDGFLRVFSATSGMCVCVCVCVCVCGVCGVCVALFSGICVYIHMYMYVCMIMLACIYVHVYVYVYVYVYISWMRLLAPVLFCRYECVCVRPQSKVAAGACARFYVMHRCMCD